MSDQLSHFTTTTPLPDHPHGHDFPTQTAALRLSGGSLTSCFTTGAADSQVTCGVSAKYSASLFARSPRRNIGASGSNCPKLKVQIR